MADAARVSERTGSAGRGGAGRGIDGGTAWLSVARGRAALASGWRLQPARSSMSGWLSGKVDAFMNGERTLIGEDAAGNQFWEIPNPGGHPDPRREVSFPSPDLEDFDMNTVATEWRMWLYHARDLPPTDEEILRSQRERQAIYERALEIDKQDALQRQVELESKRLEAASGHGAQRDDAAVDGASTHADGEASGSGDSFKVGVFDPTKIDAP
eukprot:Tamp_27727.p1 GENE.Tamp_27727~~Tamp_27727.p1  ORF type:complete len:232 (+),score=36.75 Tamp_27727:59-697(+)